MRGPDGTPLAGTRLALFLELEVWMPLVADEAGGSKPLVLSGEHPDELLVFSAIELALAVDLPHTDVQRCSVWTALRRLPPATALTIDLGQDDEVVVPADEVDDLLGAPRDELPALSPGACAAMAYAWLLVASVRSKILVHDRGPDQPPRVPAWTHPTPAKQARPPRGRIRQIVCADLLRGLPPSYELGVDTHDPGGVVIDPGTTRPAVLRAHELFPPGHLADLRPAADGLAELAAAVGASVDPPAEVCALGYQTYGGPPLHLVVVDLPPDASVLPAVREALARGCAELAPQAPVRLVCLEELPAVAAAQVRPLLVGATA